MHATYSIGEVASRFGLSPSALRYYESLGLLAEPLRVSGRRRYDDAALDRLAMIGVAQRAGFSLREARVLLDGLDACAPPTQQWRELARRKVAEIDELVLRAQATRRLLHTLLDCDCLELEDIAAFRRANREWARADRDTAESERLPPQTSSGHLTLPGDVNLPLDGPV